MALNSNISSTCPHNMVNLGPLTAEICWRVWGTPANFNGFHVLAALLHGTLVVGASQTLRRWTEGATYITLGIDPRSSSFIHSMVGSKFMNIRNLNTLLRDKKLQGKTKFYATVLWKRGYTLRAYDIQCMTHTKVLPHSKMCFQHLSTSFICYLLSTILRFNLI